MTDGIWIALIAMFIGGLAIATQAPMNARLGFGVGSGVLAALISFGVGFVVLFVVVAARVRFPGWEAVVAVPWWAWTGGALGSFYVWASIYSVPRLGVLTMSAMLILGQLTGSLLLDALGAFGLPERAISWQRIVAAAMVGAGVVLSLRS